MNKYLRLLRNNPDYTRVWLAQAISLMGDWFDTIVLAALVARYATALTGDESRSGLAVSGLLLARFLPPLLVSPAAGVLLDRFDRKKLMIFSDVARVFIVLGFLVATTPDRLWWIYLLTVIQFVLSSLFEPGRSALMPSICREEDLVTANLLGSMTWSVMLAVGGMLGGFVAGALGTTAALVLDALSFAVSALLIAQIRPKAPVQHADVTDPTETTHASAKDFIDGLRYARKHPSVAAALIVKAGGNVGSLDTVLIIFATALFVVGENGVISLGILWGAFGLGALLGPILLGRFNDGSVRTLRRLIILGYATLVIGWLVIGAAPSLLIAALGMTFKAIGSSIYWTYSSVILQKTVDHRFMGRMFSLDFAGFQFATVASVLITGLALQLMGNDQVRTVVFVTAAASLTPLVLWITIVGWLERYERRREPEPIPETLISG